jgi:hypothetical protein
MILTEKTLQLTDRQLCLLSSSALELKNVLEKAVKQELSMSELVDALKLLETATSCILLEVKHDFEITDVEEALPC